MPEEKRRFALPDHLTRSNSEANKVFAKLGAELEKHMKDDVAEIDVLKIAQSAGLQLTQEILDELHIDRIIQPLHFAPWYIWYPWRPIYCWWWNRYYPYYRWCCPWYWNHCHYWYR